MEAALLSSRAVSPISMYTAGAEPCGIARASPTSQMAPASPASCVLPITLGSMSTAAGLRSSIWGAERVQCNSEYGTVSFLLLTPGISKEGGMAGDRGRGGIARSYMENKNPIANFFNNVRGSLPVVGLLARIMSPEGGVGSDRIRLEEFCTRVERNCTRQAASAFYEFSDRHGKVAKSQFVLIWCWAAALGAGLLRSDDLLMAASRLRVSFDIQYEVENLELLMDEALKKREKSGSPIPDVPIEIRAEKALEAICKCCTGTLEIEEEDSPLLSTILKTVFPTADGGQIDQAIQLRIRALSDGSENSDVSKDSEEVASEGADSGRKLEGNESQSEENATQIFLVETAQ